MLSLLCPKCRQTLQVDPKFAGQTVRCPKCSQLLRAPAAVPPRPAAPVPTVRPSTVHESQPAGGPERLGAWESPAVVIVGVVGLLLGTWQGAAVAEGGVLFPALSGLFWALFLGGLSVLLLSGLAYLLKLRGDVLFVGSWGPFWAVFVPAVVLLASAVVGVLGVRSYFWGGVLGGWVGIGTMLVLAATNAWKHARAALGFQR